MTASLLPRCEDPDAWAALAYLQRHVTRAERLGLRVTLCSEKQLVRDKRIPGAHGPLCAGVYRSTARRRWMHLNRSALEDALRHSRELSGLLELLEDATSSAHHACTGRILRSLCV
ncbi:MAG TPA: hypothetical protein VGP82_17760 [Ktedonobacterales bacterium]|jgi:hypothetical protein|nr:hypothetical protein [Ktedonobacterales bacterium]